jgi:methyl-accepting chemotaxis protein
MNSLRHAFRNLTIRTKLILGFVVVTAFVAGAGWLGDTATSTMARNAEMMYERQFIPLSHLLRLAEAYQRTRVYALNFMLIRDSAEVQKMKKTVPIIFARLDTSVTLYGDGLQSDKERELYHRLQDSVRFFKQTFSEVIRLGEQGLTDSAWKYYRRGPGDAAARGMYIAITDLINTKLSQAEHAKISSVTGFHILERQLMGFTGLALLVAVGIGWLLARTIAKPIRMLDKAAKQVAEGNTEVHVEVQRRDEIGSLSESFNTMVASIRQGIHDLQREKASVEERVRQAVQQSEEERAYLQESVNTALEAMQHFSEGKLNTHLTIKQHDEIGKLFEGFNNVVSTTGELVWNLKTAINTTAQASTEISEYADSIAAATQEQQAQMISIDEMVHQSTNVMTFNNELAMKAAAEATEAGKNAVESGNVVKSTIEEMNRITDIVGHLANTIEVLKGNSDNINDIVNVIKEIADQTNLLALNASIEAARAGEQGRGFAVVADEVRKLAERTTDATKEVSDIVRRIHHDTMAASQDMNAATLQVQRGRELALKAGEALQHILTQTDNVARRIGFVADANQQQLTTTQQIALGVGEMSVISRQTAKDTTQIAAASDNLKKLSLRLQTMVAHFSSGNETVPHHTTSTDKLIEEPSTTEHSSPRQMLSLPSELAS